MKTRGSRIDSNTSIEIQPGSARLGAFTRMTASRNASSFPGLGSNRTKKCIDISRLQHAAELVCEEVRVVASENQRGTDLDHVVQRAVRARQNPALAEKIHHARRLLLRGELDAEKQPAAAHVGDIQLLQPLDEMRAHPRRVFRQP